jgi:hypothetical protein
MTTYTEALTEIPESAECTSAFGNPGEGGYAEYHRTLNGYRWVIRNGSWDATAPFDWTCTKLGIAA